MAKLKAIRAEKGLTQAGLAITSGIDSRRISMIENSRYIPNDGEKEKLAKALGVDVDDIGWCRVLCPTD